MGRSAWLFWLACGLSIAAHFYAARLLLGFHAERHGVAAPPTEAVSVNIEASDILNSPEEEAQSASSAASTYVPEQAEVRPPEEQPQETAPPPEPEQTAKAEEAQEDTERRRA